MRTNLYFFLSISSILLNCNQKKVESTSSTMSATRSNITQEAISDMQWMNPPQSFEVVDSALRVTVSKGTDFFNNPEDSAVVGSAPYLYKEVAGDFIAKAIVQPDFSSQWNAVALFVHLDSLNWIKFAFENSDATGPSIVSVVTKGTSDDANGVILNKEKKVWLAIARKGNIYALHWSLDGENFKMTRLTSMPNQEVVKIGIEAQSPVGDSATHQIHFFEIEKITTEDLRNIN
jgi:regulation of enolase protein 1 (concanavalin A-like superfamily)